MLRVGFKSNLMGHIAFKKSKRFQKMYKKLTRLGVPKIIMLINSSVQLLQNESDMDTLRAKLRFHKLNNYMIEVDGTKYKNPYDIHIPGGGSNNNNDLVILFDYDHEAKQILLIDIGTHNDLNLNGSTLIDNELICL